MSFWQLFLTGWGLSMDAVAVSMVSGMCMKQLRGRQALVIALAFGGFQGLMPLLGYATGAVFADFMAAFAPWIALVLLVLVGGKMIYESFGEASLALCSFSILVVLGQAVATSIDALAIGVGFAAIQVAILPAAGLIALTTFVLSGLAIGLGRIWGSFLADKAEFLGGLILVLIGVGMVL